MSGGRCPSAPAPLKDLRGWHGWSVGPGKHPHAKRGGRRSGPLAGEQAEAEVGVRISGRNVRRSGSHPPREGACLWAAPAARCTRSTPHTGCTYWTFKAAADRAHRYQRGAIRRRRPPRRVFRRRAVHRLRGGRGYRRAALEDARGRASVFAHHRQPDTLRRTAVCAGLDRRGGVRGGGRPEIQVLHGARQRGGAGCAQWRAPLEDLHDSRAEAHSPELRRHADDGTLGRFDLVRAHGRRAAQGALRGHGQRTLRTGDYRQRRRAGARHANRQSPVVQATDAGGPLERRPAFFPAR